MMMTKSNSDCDQNRNEASFLRWYCGSTAVDYWLTTSTSSMAHSPESTSNSIRAEEVVETGWPNAERRSDVRLSATRKRIQMLWSEHLWHSVTTTSKTKGKKNNSYGSQSSAFAGGSTSRCRRFRVGVFAISRIGWTVCIHSSHPCILS